MKTDLRKVIINEMRLAKEMYLSGNKDSKTRSKCDDDFCDKVTEEEFIEFKKDNGLLNIIGNCSPFYSSGNIVNVNIDELK